MPISSNRFLIGLDIEGVIESEVTSMRHTFHYKDAVQGQINPEGCSPDYKCFMVQRNVFDNALVERAVKSGTVFFDGFGVTEIDIIKCPLSVQGCSKTGVSSTLTADYLIGADGALGPTVRAMGIRPSSNYAIGMEIELAHEWGTGASFLQPSTLHLEYGAVPRGYAWIFPKKDHLNIGAGIFRPKVSEGKRELISKNLLKQAIVQFAHSVGLEVDENAQKYYAHPLPVWQGKERLQDAGNRVLLTGDAARLINPFFGDGILHAMISGEIAATCIAEGAAGDYTSRAHQHFANNFDTALKLAKFFYQFPGLCYNQVVKNRSSSRAAAKMLAGETPFPHAVQRLKSKFGIKV